MSAERTSIRRWSFGKRPPRIPALAELHVKTWNATYPGVRRSVRRVLPEVDPLAKPVICPGRREESLLGAYANRNFPRTPVISDYRARSFQEIRFSLRPLNQTGGLP